MKRLTTILWAVMLSLALYAQSMTLSVNNQPIRTVLPQIEEMSGYHFFYNSSSLIGLDKIVSINLKDAALESVLKELFAGTNIEYRLMDNKVIALSNAEKKAEQTGRSVTGVVYDEQNLPIIGASVLIKNTANGTITDFDGNFAIDNIKTGQWLQVSYLGYETYELRVNANSDNYKVVLKESTSQLDEVVVVGYGAQKKVNLTGAVSVVSADDITGRPTQNMATALQGADPALNITMSAGGPNADYNIDIRGVASINNSAGTKPLILVDGVEMSLNRVNSNDIESVSILKDASAAAIYGAKAAAGVVLVQTKSGKEGRAPQVTIDAKAGWKSNTTKHEYITQGFWSAYVNDLFMYNHAGNNTTTYDEEDYAELWMRLDDETENPERPWTVVQEDGSYKYYANHDWYRHYFKTTRPMQDYNVSVQGGMIR